MNLRYILFVFALLTHMMLFAQTYNGQVKGKDGVPLVGASVVASADKSIVAYCITNDKGAFKLTIPEGKHPTSVAVSYMGYQKRSIPFTELKDGMSITLEEGGVKLKEVKVKAERIKSIGDTQTYSVSSFKQAQDRSIADVIAKMPLSQYERISNVKGGRSIGKKAILLESY